MKRRRSMLAVAIEREDWDTAAVVLLLGLVERASKLPPETLEEMMPCSRKRSRTALARGRGGERMVRRRSPERFYAESLNEAEKLSLPVARQMEGLDEEIAVLRVRLQTAIAEYPEDFRLLTHGIDALVKAVATQYRLSPRARKDLADRMTGLLNALGDQLLPAGR